MYASCGVKVSNNTIIDLAFMKILHHKIEKKYCVEKRPVVVYRKWSIKNLMPVTFYGHLLEVLIS